MNGTDADKRKATDETTPHHTELNPVEGGYLGKGQNEIVDPGANMKAVFFAPPVKLSKN
jgi:hypothetical protein